ncbi:MULTISPECIES: hypothetical protein [Eubacterium]|uniref:hypothetical protein n=1 Tax=Eubacterium TaxID=1730 RepID=UPI001A9B8CAD|nr:MULTISPECIES: hypothetical protein [Eubacterium]
MGGKLKVESGRLWNVFVDAKTTGTAAAGRIQSNRPTADLHLNFPLSTFNFKSLFFNALSLDVKVCLQSEIGAKLRRSFYARFQ